jgi:hypothetical protein
MIFDLAYFLHCYFLKVEIDRESASKNPPLELKTRHPPPQSKDRIRSHLWFAKNSSELHSIEYYVEEELFNVYCQRFMLNAAEMDGLSS